MGTGSGAFSLMLLAVTLLYGSMGVAHAAGDGMAAIDKDSFASLGVEDSDDVWLIELCVRQLSASPPPCLWLDVL